VALELTEAHPASLLECGSHGSARACIPGRVTSRWIRACRFRGRACNRVGTGWDGGFLRNYRRDGVSNVPEVQETRLHRTPVDTQPVTIMLSYQYLISPFPTRPGKFGKPIRHPTGRARRHQRGPAPANVLTYRLPGAGAGWSRGRESAERDLLNIRFIQGGNCAPDATASRTRRCPMLRASFRCSGSTALY
jgi:hypothetical protein